jgi:hypothetical protein
MGLGGRRFKGMTALTFAQSTMAIVPRPPLAI